MILKVILLSIGLMLLAFAGIGIKILARKNGQFAGTCSTNNPHLKEKGIGCGCGNSGSCTNKNY
jgi:hypothetical protein